MLLMLTCLVEYVHQLYRHIQSEKIVLPSVRVPYNELNTYTLIYTVSKNYRKILLPYSTVS